MTCDIASVMPPGLDFPNLPGWEDGQAHHEFNPAGLPGFLSFCENQCTEGQEESESTGTNSGLVSTQRQSTVEMYILTQSPKVVPGHLVDIENVCIECTINREGLMTFSSIHTKNHNALVHTAKIRIPKISEISGQGTS